MRSCISMRGITLDALIRSPDSRGSGDDVDWIRGFAPAQLEDAVEGDLA